MIDLGLGHSDADRTGSGGCNMSFHPSDDNELSLTGQISALLLQELLLTKKYIEGAVETVVTFIQDPSSCEMDAMRTPPSAAGHTGGAVWCGTSQWGLQVECISSARQRK